MNAETILLNLNRQLIRERRNILLLMDNVSSHSHDLTDKFSNIKVVFLPVNTTSRLQPLNAGVTKNFKVFYLKCLVNTHWLESMIVLMMLMHQPFVSQLIYC